MKDEILKRMELMKGKTFMYNTFNLRVTDWDFNESTERILLYTTRRTEPYDRPIEDAEAFLDQFTPIPESALEKHTETTTMAGLTVFQGGLSNQLKDILLDNIEKVRDNKDYIPQAEAISANVGQLIDLAKVEVQYMHAVAKLNKSGGGEF